MAAARLSGAQAWTLAAGASLMIGVGWLPSAHAQDPEPAETPTELSEITPAEPTVEVEIVEAEAAVDGETAPGEEAPFDEEVIDEPSFFERYLDIHLFGGWGAGVTSANEYGFGAEDPEFRNIEVALRFLATVHEQLRISVGLSYAVEADEQEFQLDFGHALWSPIDELTVNAGRVVFPHGFYTPIYDVPTLRPMGTLPLGIYGEDSGFVAEGYDGVGLDVSTETERTWVKATGWFGTATIGEADALVAAIDDGLAGLPPPADDDDEGERLRYAGGALVEVASLSGAVEVQVGGYLGQSLEEEVDPITMIPVEEKELHWTLLTGIRYRHEGLEATAEYGLHADGDEALVHSAYLQMSYLIAEHWQPVVRGEISAADFDGSAAATMFDSLTYHRSAAVGFNYWQSPDLVFKLSYQYVSGNLLAHPEIDDALAGSVESTTHYGEFSVGFSY